MRIALVGLAALALAAAAPHGIVIANMDPAVKPGNDFFMYANGGWIARTAIPPDRASTGVFNELADHTDQQTWAVIGQVAASHPAAGTEAGQIAGLERAYLDEAGIDRRGLAPLHAQFAAIAAIANRTALAQQLGASLRADVDPLNDTNFHTANLFGLWVAPGFHDPAHNAAYLLQGGLELPDREYYLSDAPEMRTLRLRYQRHIAAMLGYAGFDQADARAARVLELELAIAVKHAPLAQSEDLHAADNAWSVADFSQKAPGLEWKEFFLAAGLEHVVRFDVWQPTAFAGESALVASAPLEDWKDWLIYHVIEDYAQVLPKPIRDESFAFFGVQVAGTPQQRPRWQVALAQENAELGDAVGKLYAAKYFPPTAKQEAQAMVANLIAVYHQRIAALDWMNPATKAEAQKKLDALYVGIGYPETWRSYAGLEIKPDDAFGDVWRGALFQYHYALGQLEARVNRSTWCMTPQTVNAVNLPLQVALNFPAAILQPPFFDPQAPAAVNYGAIGAVIGHEVSHTFDTEGSAIDAQGRLRNWWTPADFAHFQEATQRLAQQYDAYRPFSDLAVNGPQTLAENIADVAGVAAAYDAYHRALGGEPGPRQGGFSADQQFFIAFGQDWASKIRPAALRHQVLTDEHAPARYRTATVRNLDAWYAAFNPQPGQELYLAPAARVRIW
ncbi:MAG: M13 family metallopeptidase [Terriglobales bacterium]